MYFLGIDPGITGALALLDEKGKPVTIKDLPIMLKGKGGGAVKNQINCRALYLLLSEIYLSIYTSIDAYNDIIVSLEQVGAMPAQGVSSVFSLGQTFGSILGVLSAFAWEINLISPIRWKNHFNITKDKELARSTAINMYPSAAEYLQRKKDHNRAEALLIARYQYEQYSRGR